MFKPYPPSPVNNLNPLAPRPSVSIVLLCCLFIFFLMATAFIMQFLVSKLPNQAAALRIGAVIQDVLIFVLPAIATAMVSTRLPARLLMVDSVPSLPTTWLTLIVMIVSVPAMNMLIDWNSSLQLPESMSAIASQMKEMEDAAQKSVDTLMGGSSIGSLIISILIIGIMAGFSEELFFRGALQRLMTISLKTHPHVAIWVTAFIFSAFHLQFFGFVPRFLLGAFFGYLAFWSGSLWLPIIAHVFNNSLVVVVHWVRQRLNLLVDVDKIGANTTDASDLTLLIFSTILTGIGIYLIYRSTNFIHKKSE